MQYDTRITAVRAHGRLLLRRHSSEDVLHEEYVLGDVVEFRTPLVRTVGAPEPGLPMDSSYLATSDAVEMFSALVRASRETDEVRFAGGIVGSYRREWRRRGRYVLTELLGVGSQMSIGRVRIDSLDVHLLERALESLER